MKYLIYHGADIMHSDGLGMTPLHYAALGGCEYCVSYLISLGAQINHETKNGKTPLALIENRENQNSCCEYLERNGACTVANKIPIKKMH
jgi:ankyrin repeat protein